jgi:hypothetical protein
VNGSTYLGTSQIMTLETIQIAGAAGGLLLDSGSMDHHGYSLFGVKFGFPVQAREAEKRVLGLVKFALSYKPPRRLGSKEDDDD